MKSEGYCTVTCSVRVLQNYVRTPVTKSHRNQGVQALTCGKVEFLVHLHRSWVPEKDAASSAATACCSKHRKMLGLIFVSLMIKFGNFGFVFGIKDLECMWRIL